MDDLIAYLPFIFVFRLCFFSLLFSNVVFFCKSTGCRKLRIFVV